MRRLILLSTTLSLLAAPAWADSLEGATIEDIIEVLHDRGLIDDDQRTRMVLKHQTEQGSALPSASEALFRDWHWSGDLRLRYEGFRYPTDSLGNRRSNRHRFRYRARLGFEKAVNGRISVGMRFTSGQDLANRTTNQTIGVGSDFDRDELNIDRAFARIELPSRGALSSQLVAGKIANPFYWKYGPDFMIWDHDLSPEGAALVASYPLSERTELIARLGGFIIRENNLRADPKVFAGQLGGTHSFGNGVRVGLRVSGYEWRTLDTLFVGRAAAVGNLPSAFDSRARIAEVYGFARFEPHADWPILGYATGARNFTADRAVLASVRTDDEDTAWGVGLEVGDRKAIAQLGFGYYRVEANAVVAQFYDSDLFDGRTNRQGWLAYLRKSLWSGVLLNLEYLDSDSIEDSAPFVTSATFAERRRIRTDLIFSF